jgi:GNAT superfamily N-acetyltransferase
VTASGGVEVRPLAAQDHPAWEPLWHAYLTFYDSSVPDQISAATFARLVQRADGMGGLVAVDGDDRPVGLLHYVVHATTWNTRPVCYLEDLFVTPDQRRTGAGRALIEHLADRGRRQGWAEIYWLTAAGNHVARRLYDRLATVGPWVRYQLPLDASKDDGS